MIFHTPVNDQNQAVFKKICKNTVDLIWLFGWHFWSCRAAGLPDFPDHCLPLGAAGLLQAKSDKALPDDQDFFLVSFSLSISRTKMVDIDRGCLAAWANPNHALEWGLSAARWPLSMSTIFALLLSITCVDINFYIGMNLQNCQSSCFSL